MSQMQLEAYFVDEEGNNIESYFFASDDADDVMDDAIARANDENLSYDMLYITELGAMDEIDPAGYDEAEGLRAYYDPHTDTGYLL